jgi:hypothetical protein
MATRYMGIARPFQSSAVARLDNGPLQYCDLLVVVTPLRWEDGQLMGSRDSSVTSAKLRSTASGAIAASNRDNSALAEG